LADRLAAAAAPGDVAGALAWLAQVAVAAGLLPTPFTTGTLPGWMLLCEVAAAGSAEPLPALAASLREALPPPPAAPKQRPVEAGPPTGVYAAAAAAALAHAGGKPMSPAELAAAALRLHALPPALEASAEAGVAAALAADATSVAAFALLHPAPGPEGAPLYTRA
jgi:hypothetical protein